MSETIIFCHDSITIYYPTGAGRVYAITFRALVGAAGDDATFADLTTVTDIAGMLTEHIGHDHVPAARLLAPLSFTAPPRTWTNLTDDDLADALEAWADYCDREVAAEEGEVAAVSRAA